MQATAQTVHFTSGSANSIALSQTAAGAGALSVNGSLASVGVATLPQPRRVSITSLASNESSETITLFGTNYAGAAISETIAGPTASATVTSVYDYKTVTAVTISAATGSNISLGTTGNPVGSTPWILPNRHVTPFSVGAGLFLTTGSMTWSVEKTYDDPNQLVPSNSAVPPNVFPVSNLTSVSNTLDDVITVPATAIRLTVNTGTGTGTFYTLQAGLKQ